MDTSGAVVVVDVVDVVDVALASRVLVQKAVQPLGLSPRHAGAAVAESFPAPAPSTDAGVVVFVGPSPPPHTVT